MRRDRGHRGRDLRKALHFRVDDTNVQGIEKAVELLGISQDDLFNNALDLWFNQPHIRAVLEEKTHV